MLIMANQGFTTATDFADYLVKEKNLETQMIEVYKQGIDEFERGDVIFAGRKFSEAELLFPQSIWAPRAVLMSAYGYFSQGYYSYAINDLERFLIKYKNHPQTDYAYYLMALCHYDQIIDEKKDLKEILLAKKYFEIVINNYPNTDYAKDSKYKLDYILEYTGPLFQRVFIDEANSIRIPKCS